MGALKLFDYFISRAVSFIRGRGYVVSLSIDASRGSETSRDHDDLEYKPVPEIFHQSDPLIACLLFEYSECAASLSERIYYNTRISTISSNHSSAV